MIDFTMLRRSPFEGALDPLVEASAAYRDARNRSTEHDKDLALQRETEARKEARDQQQHDEQERRLDLQERRQVGEATLHNTQKRAETTAAIRAAVARGDMVSAQALSEQFGVVDPRTGDVQQGGLFERLPPQVEEGPRETPEIAAEAGKERGRLSLLRANFDRNAPFAKKADAGGYQTPLTPDEEAQFRKWVADSKAPFNPDDKMSDYDMRGYWKDIAAKGGDSTQRNATDGEMHYPDTYKTPYHQSFSAESRYATPDAPKWTSDTQLTGSDGKVSFDETKPPQPDSRYVDEAQAERERFASANDQEAAARRNAENPRIRIGGVETTPNDVRYSAGKKDAEDFATVGQSLQGDLARAKAVGDPVIVMAAQNKLDRYGELYSAVQTGALPVGKAIAELTKAGDASDKAELGRMHDVGTWRNNVDVQKEHNNHPWFAPGSGGTGQGNLVERKRNDFEQRVSKLADRFDLPKDVKGLSKNASAIEAASSPSGLLQTSAAYELAKEVSGGGGQSLSNRDVEQMSARAGGLERLKGIVGRYVDGRALSDGEQQVLADALRFGAKSARERISKFNAEATKLKDPRLPWSDELGPDYIDGVINYYVPDEARSPVQSARPAAPAAPAAPAKKPAASGGGETAGQRKARLLKELSGESQ